MNQPMMAAAEQDQVGEIRRTAICPMFDVVRVGPSRWTVATRESAAFVSGDQRTSRRTRHYTAAVVGLAIDDGCDRGVAGQAAGRFGAHRAGPIHPTPNRTPAYS